MKKKHIAIVVTLLILSVAVAVPTIVSAAGSTATSRPGSLTATFKELIQGLVDTGKLAQADADATLTALDAKAAELKANRPDKAGFGRLGGLDLSEVATILGLTEDQLKEKLTTDTTLWKIASEAGKLDALKSAIVTQAEARLKEQVTAGRLTQTEADTQLTTLKEKVAAITADTTYADLGLAFADGRKGRGGAGGRMAGGDADAANADGTIRPDKRAGRSAANSGTTSENGSATSTSSTSAA